MATYMYIVFICLYSISQRHPDKKYSRTVMASVCKQMAQSNMLPKNNNCEKQHELFYYYCRPRRAFTSSTRLCLIRDTLYSPHQIHHCLSSITESTSLNNLANVDVTGLLCLQSIGNPVRTAYKQYKYILKEQTPFCAEIIYTYIIKLIS